MTNTKKRNLLAAGVILCALLSGIGTTMAYFTESAQETNVFTTGDLDIGLKEPEWDPKDNLTRVDPGPDSRLQPFRAGGIPDGESSLGKGYGKIYGV